MAGRPHCWPAVRRGRAEMLGGRHDGQQRQRTPRRHRCPKRPDPGPEALDPGPFVKPVDPALMHPALPFRMPAPLSPTPLFRASAEGVARRAAAAAARTPAEGICCPTRPDPGPKRS